MKYANNILCKNEICRYIIQILGNRSTETKLMVMENHYEIDINNQWEITGQRDNGYTFIQTIQDGKLVFEFFDLSKVDYCLMLKVKETIRDLLYSKYSNDRVFDLIYNFNPNLLILRTCISLDNRSYFRWVLRVSGDGGLELRISVYSTCSYEGDICIVLIYDKILEFAFREPCGVSHICRNPNDSSELTEFIKKLDSKLSDEKDKQL